MTEFGAEVQNNFGMAVLKLATAKMDEAMHGWYVTDGMVVELHPFIVHHERIREF